MAIERHIYKVGSFHTGSFYTTSDFWECPNCGELNPSIRTHKELDPGNDACACGWLPDGSEPDAHVEEIVKAANAAPDLLDALVDVIGWVSGPNNWHTDAPQIAVQKARAAIAKARGE